MKKATELEKAFHRAMIGLYERARDEVGYVPSRFLKMVNEHGGLEAARMLLERDGISDGCIRLWEAGRLDLAMEDMILRPEWAPLFADEQRRVAAERLRALGHEAAA